MKHLSIPLSALLAVLLPAGALAQSASSVSSMSSSVSSMSSVSQSSLSSSSLSSSRSSSLSSSRSSMTSRSSSVSSARLNFDDIDLDRYSDVDDWDMSTSIAVSALTRIDVLRGNDDGTFMPERRLNRAEFIEIIMRLVPDEEDETVRTNCFVDINANAWYAESVCRAKMMGIVRGNAQAGVPESQWRFEASRDVQYEEAIKVLVKLYALPITGNEEGMDWYVPFIEAAADYGLAIEGLSPGDRLTRGEMARLTVGFVAHSSGQLEEYRDAQDRDWASSRSSSRSSVSSSWSSMSSSRSSSGSGVFDTLDDTSARTNILLLGETSPIIAGVRFFSNLEPVLVDEVVVEMTSDVDSIASLLIYTSEGEFLGTATVESNGTTFTADIPSGRYVLPRREDRSIYVRARLKADDSGGVSGEWAEVESVTLRGDGEWSNDSYTSTSSDTFPASQTAAARITDFTATGDANGVLSSGTQRLLGSFRVDAESPVAGQNVRLTALNFDIEQAGGVTLTNVYLRDGSSGDRSDCTVSSSVVTCNSISSSIGIIDDTRTIQVYGDVGVASTGGNISLRLVISDPGSPTNAGDVTWTDGSTTFTWVQFTQPVVYLTQFR